MKLASARRVPVVVQVAVMAVAGTVQAVQLLEVVIVATIAVVDTEAADTGAIDINQCLTCEML